MLSNPPFGVDWKKAQKTIKAEHDTKRMSGRFGAGLPRINDGSLLFLQHMISKMKPALPADDAGGSRIAIVFNGSPLFTGGAESGESNIRKWIIENDWLEAIIALPDQLFYNTGISTYIWIVTNHKSEERKGKVQLINATGAKDEELYKEGKIDFNRFWQKMDRSLGNKRKKIADVPAGKAGNEFCKVYPNEFFGYRRVTVEQPLRENGEVVTDRKGNPKADSSLRDYENIPFLKKDQHGNLVPQSIEDYFKTEIKPHLPEAWIDESKTKIGYEINFTKYFYEFKPLRPLAEIKADILALEEKVMEMEKNVLNHDL
jgi:type I restriction enzyme M protein